MWDSVLGVAGISISILIFLIGYRQTVGAKKERIRSANADVEKILVRRVVLEGYTPSRSDVARLLQGKGRDFRVSDDELLSEAQVLNTVYTRIVESDLIPTDQREEILKRLMPALSESESRPVDEASGRGTSARALRTSTLLLSALAGAASLIGGIVSILPDIASASTKFRDAVVPAVATIVTSLAVLSAIIALYRLRASQEAVDTKAGEVDRYVAFEMEVARLLRRLGANPIRGRPDEGVDFIIELHDKRILVEVKSWSQPMPTKLVAELAERLVNALKRTQASEAIVVTPEPLREPVPLSADSKVKFMTPQQLRNYLAHSKGGRDAV
jgi:predicted AAA+ superfamily ATPase